MRVLGRRGGRAGRSGAVAGRLRLCQPHVEHPGDGRDPFRSPADDADEEAGERYEDLFLERPNYSVIETADYLPQFVGKPPNFAPGEGCRYCNVGYVLLGLLIERATGSSYRSHVAEHVFAPAGMNRSAFFRTWSNRMSPRASKRSRTRTVASLDGAATSTPTPGRWTQRRRPRHRRGPLALPPGRDRRASSVPL
jgi:CubicO group peptidase (beta-lactamase class C family)